MMTSEAEGYGLGVLEEPFNTLVAAIAEGSDPMQVLDDIDTLLTVIPDSDGLRNSLGEELLDCAQWIATDNPGHPWTEDQRSVAFDTLIECGTHLFELHPCAALTWAALATPGSSERSRMRTEIAPALLVPAASRLGSQVLTEALEFLRAHGRPVSGPRSAETTPLAVLLAFADPLAGLGEPDSQSDAIPVAPAIPTRMPWGTVALADFGAMTDVSPEDLWIPR